MKNSKTIAVWILFTMSSIFTIGQILYGYQLQPDRTPPAIDAPLTEVSTTESYSPMPTINGELVRQRQKLAETRHSIEELEGQLAEYSRIVHPNYETLKLQADSDTEKAFFAENPFYARSLIRLRMAEQEIGLREATTYIMSFWGLLVNALDLDPDRRTRIINEMITTQRRNLVWGAERTLGLRDISAFDANQESPYSVINNNLSEEEMKTFWALDQKWGKQRSRDMTESALIGKAPELNRAARSRVVDIYEVLTAVPLATQYRLESSTEHQLRQLALVREQLQDGFSQEELNGIDRFISGKEKELRRSFELNRNLQIERF